MSDMKRRDTIPLSRTDAEARNRRQTNGIGPGGEACASLHMQKGVYIPLYLLPNDSN